MQVKRSLDTATYQRFSKLTRAYDKDKDLTALLAALWDVMMGNGRDLRHLFAGEWGILVLICNWYSCCCITNELVTPCIHCGEQRGHTSCRRFERNNAMIIIKCEVIFYGHKFMRFRDAFPLTVHLFLSENLSWMLALTPCSSYWLSRPRLCQMTLLVTVSHCGEETTVAGVCYNISYPLCNFAMFQVTGVSYSQAIKRSLTLTALPWSLNDGTNSWLCGSPSSFSWQLVPRRISFPCILYLSPVHDVMFAVSVCGAQV
jgi:hypothetical protein